jgi:DNA repair protein RecN (Recombination protein N)
MLRQLSVQNLALIEDVRVELSPGFCAWTGETGAGKSLLLGAIGLLLGERGSADLIRAGQEELRVVGRFDLTRPEQKTAAEEILQTPVPDDELILSRRLTRSGRSSALVNETPVAVGTLRKLGEMLVDVHGQRDSYSLLQPAYQLELLDAFGKLTEQRAKYVAAAEQVRECRRQFHELTTNRQNRQRELTLIRFERDELVEAALVEGELDAIQKERERLLNAQELAGFNAGVAAQLSDDEGCVAERLGKLIRQAHQWGRFDPRIEAVANRLDLLRPEVQDIAETCRDLSEAFEADPERLDEIERRIQQLKKLEAKYVKTISDLIVYRDSLSAKEAELQRQEDDLGGISSRLNKAFSEMKAAAAVLSKGRVKVAKKLAAEAQKHLVDLQMPNAKLEAVLEPVPLGDDPTAGEVPPAGADHLELMLTANPGEPARPLRKVASGGEMSRTMLALKTVLAAHDPVRTLVVFDEIDANVGGRLGDVLGQKLAALGDSHQVLCVTHLPQVASYAARQWTIRKSTTGKRTSTTITELTTKPARVEELAMMLRGEARTETTTKEAAEMLKASQR